jgi:hypothetical protein
MNNNKVYKKKIIGWKIGRAGGGGTAIGQGTLGGVTDPGIFGAWIRKNS